MSSHRDAEVAIWLTEVSQAITLLIVDSDWTYLVAIYVESIWFGFWVPHVLTVHPVLRVWVSS